MLQKIRNSLRKNPLLHNSYMRLKRTFSSELLGMTSKTEQDYLAHYGAKLYGGQGEIVDLGCWLGSTTIPLTKGLRKNPAFLAFERKVYAYDLFIWFDWMNPSVAGTNLFGKFVEGENFVDEFRKRIDRYESSIEVRAGDLKEIGWSGGKIEFLLVDAMKNWDLSNAIVSDFYPSLIAGQSLVFHQDFAHYFTPWIHVIHWRLRDHFAFVEEVPRSQSVFFRCTKPIPRELSDNVHSFESFDDSDVERAFDYSMGLVSTEKLPNVAAAKVMWFVHQKKLKEAERVLNELQAKNVPMEKDMLTVQQLITAA